jgi:N-acetylneuraminic acid mutarotase
MTGIMNDSRGRHTDTLLNDGKVLVTGEYNGTGYLNSAEIYETSTGIWIRTLNMNDVRSYQTASILANGNVLVIGGLVTNNETVSSCEVYDVLRGDWTVVGNLIYERARHTTSVLHNEKVLVADGNQNDIALHSTELY